MSKKTPLFEEHQKAHAQWIDFHGWHLPLHYGSQLEEHLSVRRDAGMFDVSHMTIVDLLGAGGRQFLRDLLANDVDKLKHAGQALYSCMLAPNGGVLDDLIVYQRAPDHYRIILNSATREKDLAWIQKHAEGLPVGIQERTDLAMIAIQGPRAIQKTVQTLASEQIEAVSALKPFESVELDGYFFAHTGYTGEHGLEVILPRAQAAHFWQNLVRNGVKPCGLGARDSLRLEAGMMLYGQDMDETTTPLEAALGWTLAWEPQDRNFIGRTALSLQRQQGIQRKLVGLRLLEKGVMRAGQKIFVEGVGEGIITSGTYSPILNRSIAFGRVPVKTEKQCSIEIRGKRLQAEITKPRFIQNGHPLQS